MSAPASISSKLKGMGFREMPDWMASENIARVAGLTDFQSVGAILAKRRASQTADILRGWFRDEFGPECPTTDEDIITVAAAKGYSSVRLVPPTGNTETLALLRDGTTIRSIGVAKPF